MTDKVKQWIYYFDTLYKRSGRITLQCFLTQVNNGTLPKGRNYFATINLLEQWKFRRYKKEWRLNDKKIVQATKLKSIVKAIKLHQEKKKMMNNEQIQVYMNQLLKQSLRSMTAR